MNALLSRTGLTGILIAGILSALSTFTQNATRDLQIQSFDGQPLGATYYNPGRAGPAAILFRNCDQKRSDLAEIAGTVSALGVHVVAWDYRNGQAGDLSWRETRARDASAVHDWLVSQPGVDRERVVGIGGSCGVSLAIDFAERHATSVRGLVLLSGPATTNQKAFLSRTPSIAIFGAASKAEGAAVFYIDSIVKASRNPASRQSSPDDAGHGIRMLTQDGALGASVLAWIRERLVAMP